MKKVSIIIPIYNVEKYIQRCLESVINQTYKNIEVICVDDCGNDRSIEIVEKYNKQFPDIIKILYSEKNVGLGAARDKGLGIATGEYVAFIDSDDYIKRDFVERYVYEGEKSSADVVIGGFIRTEKTKIKEVIPDNDAELFAWMNVSAWIKVYKRKFLVDNSLDFCGIRRYEDEGFNYRLLLKKPIIVSISYAGYFYWLNPDSITKSKNNDRSVIFKEYLSYIDGLIKMIDCEREKKELLDYCLVSGLTANLLYNGRGCGWGKMKELYARYNNLLNTLDKNICENKYIALKYLKSEPTKKRYATWITMRFRKIRCDKILFWIASKI